ncbi:MAG TPA: hypothetical protein VNE42_04355 [Acidimicrobiales bacterium]|nr:hypothetical protein [Acidimicrobiales bacterium]
MTYFDAGEPTKENPPRASLRPALVVIAIVALIMLGGGLLAILSSRGARTLNATTRTGTLPSRLIIEGVHLGPARAFLQRTEHNALIPEDIISSLYLPTDVHLTEVINLDNGNGPFDRQINLASAGSQTQFVKAYTTLLNQYGWKQSGIESVAGPVGTKGTELLSQHPSHDGYNWEVGVTITMNAQVAQPTRIAMRLLQVPEGN